MSDAGDSVLILTPVFNDWESLRQLLLQLDGQTEGKPITVLAIDDGSTDPFPEEWDSLPLAHLTEVRVLSLRGNVGHQRAIAVGLSYVEDKWPCRAVVVMDADGEDDPKDVPRLLGRLQQEAEQAVVFAERRRRAEGCVFCLCYTLYRWLHRVLTGVPVRVGNFSAIPYNLLSRLVISPNLWNHYAAAVFKSKTRHVSVPTARAPRLVGRSRMNFESLVVHGLSAMSVFAETIGVRLLLCAGVLLALLGTGMLSTMAIRLCTDLAIPGWATSATGILAIMTLQMLTLAVIFTFLVLNGRRGSDVLPLRDYPFFVRADRKLWPTSEESHSPARGSAGR